MSGRALRLLRSISPLLIVTAAALPPVAASATDVGISVNLAPPPLPIYAQPAIPGPGYLWQPGYWGWGPAGYYWVPGTWVMPPTVGLLWTPGYWGWDGGNYLWHAGYWGPHIGFYGGIDYGFGYTGVGYAGGFWDHGAFHYNAAVNNVHNENITNVYHQAVVSRGPATHVSFNGGTGGAAARPTAQEEAAGHDQHVPATTLQSQHEQAAAANHANLASENHGRPAIAATPRPGAFTGPGIVAAHEAAAPAAPAPARLPQAASVPPQHAVPQAAHLQPLHAAAQAAHPQPQHATLAPAAHAPPAAHPAPAQAAHAAPAKGEPETRHE